MLVKFSQEMLTVIGYARDEAMRTGSYGIGADHIVLGLLRHRDNNACRALEACGIDLPELKLTVDRCVFADRAVPWADRARVRPTRAAGALLTVAGYEMLRSAQTEILVRSGQGAAADYLRARGLRYDDLYALMRGHGFILPRQEHEAPLPRLQDMLGPLGEQLTHLLGSVQDKTNIYS